MKVRAFSVACLISGALAAPMEQAQHSQQVQPQQVQPHQEPPAEGPGPFFPPGFPGDEYPFPYPGDEEDFDPEMTMMGHGQMHRPNGVLSGNVDVDAFQEMVNQVQSQVQAIEQLIHENGGDPNALMEALVDPMSELDQTLARGVSRIAIPGLGGILGGGVGGVISAVKKPAPLTLLGDLLRTVSTLLENLLTRGPIGELLNGLLGGVLGGIGGTVGGVLGGGAATQVPNLVDSILGSVGTLLPGGAGGLAGGLAGALP